MRQRPMAPVRGVRSARPLQPLLSEPPGRPQEACMPAAGSHPLWLCIHVPALAVDAFGGGDSGPLVVHEEKGGRAVIRSCNQPALECGIVPGTTVAAALALCETVAIRPRNRAAERSLMERLAGWALRFSSEVSLDRDQAILLEIGGSLRLFGGMEALLERIEAGLGRFVSRHALGVAPTPRAAWWLARAGGRTIVTGVGQLAGALRGLPVQWLALDRKQRLRLEHSGIRTLGDLMRLPRDGLVRRFGPEPLRQLDRALARDTEPLASFQPLQRFSADHAFYAPTGDMALIKIAAGVLLQRLEVFLGERQAVIQRLYCLLAHEQRPVTVIEVGSRRPLWRADAFAALLDVHLERTRLCAGVAAITLRSDRIDRCVPQQLDLFEPVAAEGAGWQRLLAHLEARLGRGALRRLSLHADHRPERAGACHPQAAGDSPFVGRRRPLWLLTEAKALPLAAGGIPCWHGPLQLDASVERIEQGWWDGDDVRRDYRTARSRDGSMLWLYRDLCCKRWFLHGLFG